HLLVHRVLPLGAIERDGRDAIGDLEAHRLHAAPLTRRRAAKPLAGAGAGSDPRRPCTGAGAPSPLRFGAAGHGSGSDRPVRRLIGAPTAPPLPCCAVTDRGFTARGP